jgi:peptidoglycan hydrolase-like protein with peptidoglycan-binding domain
MTLRSLFLIASAAALIPLGATGADALTSLHPEAAYPDSTQQAFSPDRYTEFTKRVQQKLHEQGFDAGPVNGAFGAKTQAALAQFQLSRTLPASGQLDGATLNELGVARDEPAADVSPESTKGDTHASQ